jgi:hypothetical protein
MLVDPPLTSLADCWPRNAAIGFTAVTQEEFNRDWPKTKAAFEALNPPFLFLSDEPSMGQIRLPDDFLALGPRAWAIWGGGTDQGPWRAPPTDPAWARFMRDQCAAAGVPFHFKQWGEWQPEPRLIDAGGPSVHRWSSGEWVERRGKAHDPCTLDGVLHDARPVPRHLGAA